MVEVGKLQGGEEEKLDGRRMGINDSQTDELRGQKKGWQGRCYTVNGQESAAA